MIWKEKWKGYVKVKKIKMDNGKKRRKEDKNHCFSVVKGVKTVSSLQMQLGKALPTDRIYSEVLKKEEVETWKWCDSLHGRFKT